MIYTDAYGKVLNPYGSLGVFENIWNEIKRKTDQGYSIRWEGSYLWFTTPGGFNTKMVLRSSFWNGIADSLYIGYLSVSTSEFIGDGAAAKSYIQYAVNVRLNNIPFEAPKPEPTVTIPAEDFDDVPTSVTPSSTNNKLMAALGIAALLWVFSK